VLTALLATACSGGDDETPNDTSASETVPSATVPTETTPSPTAATSDEPIDLAALTARMESARFSALYAVDATSVDDALTGTWQWTQDGSGRIRFDIESEGEVVVMIMSPEGVNFCAEDACFSMDAASEMFPDLGGMLTGEIDSIQEDAATSTVTAAPAQTIAGTETECYDFQDSTEDSSGTICYAPEGVPLLIDATSAEGEFRLTASTYTTDVADADFEAPYPVTAFPGMGN